MERSGVEPSTMGVSRPLEPSYCSDYLRCYCQVGRAHLARLVVIINPKMMLDGGINMYKPTNTTFWGTTL